MTDPKPYDPKTNSYWYESLAWLIREAPGLLGETSSIGGFISALESGGPGQSVASSDDHHEALLRRIGLWWDDDEKPRPNIVARFRTLKAQFARLTKQSQLILSVYYEPRCRWPSGCEANLGEELASVSLAFAVDRAQLLDACSFAESAGSKAVIEASKEQAKALIRAAHEEWNSLRPSPTAKQPTFIERLNAI